MATPDHGEGHESRVLQVAARLALGYGPRRWRSHAPPLDELVVTVLSQHTSDVNAARAFRSLRERYPSWDLVRTAATADVADAIRSGGLAEIKAPRIQGILDVVHDRGDPMLDRLAAMSIDAGRNWLCSLPGVGPKTAACVLLFALGRPALPVDTHVHRVARRVGLIGPTVPAARAHEWLEPALGGNRDRVYAFHLDLIAHGRAVCVARRPRCDRCPLTDCCDYYAAGLLSHAPPPSSPPGLG